MEGEIPVTTPTLDSNEILMAATMRLQEANALTIQTAEDLAAASELFNEIKRERDEHERSRVAEKEPYLQAGRDVDAKWKPILTTADSAASVITNKIRNFRDEANRRAQEEQRRLREPMCAKRRTAAKFTKPNG